MIDIGEIIKGMADLLQKKLVGFTIQRNTRENRDISMAGNNNGWIGVYRANATYTPERTGNNPYDGIIDIIVKVQATSLQSEASAEDALTDAEKLVMDVIADRDNLNIGGTVDRVTAFDVEYDGTQDGTRFISTAIITVRAVKIT